MPAPGAPLRDGAGRLDFAWPIDLALTVASHGWVQLAPWRWDAAAGDLARTERIDGALGTITVAQRGPQAVAIRVDGFAPGQAPAVHRRVGRWLSAEWSPEAAVAALAADHRDEAALIARGGGRMLRGSSFYEDFVKTVLTINTSWSATCRMSAALVAVPGGGAFPLPAAVLDYGEARLRAEAKLGFRAATVIAATRRLLDDGAIDDSGEGEPERLDHAYLTGLKGIGPYAAAHCRILLHDFSRIPVDSVATAYLRTRHDSDADAFALRRASCGDYLALGYALTRLRDRLADAIDPPA